MKTILKALLISVSAILSAAVYAGGAEFFISNSSQQERVINVQAYDENWDGTTKKVAAGAQNYNFFNTDPSGWVQKLFGHDASFITGTTSQLGNGKDDSCWQGQFKIVDIPDSSAMIFFIVDAEGSLHVTGDIESVSLSQGSCENLDFS